MLKNPSSTAGRLTLARSHAGVRAWRNPGARNTARRIIITVARRNEERMAPSPFLMRLRSVLSLPCRELFRGATCLLHQTCQWLEMLAVPGFGSPGDEIRQLRVGARR